MAIADIEGRRSSGIGMLVASLAACFAVGALGSYWTTMGLGPWYDGLAKPSWTPPSKVFAPAWTALYALMGVAAWLVWRARGRAGATLALALHAVQLTLNLIWPGIFFALRNPGGGFAEIALLWLSILATVVAFARVRPLAAALLLPYWIWVTYASALNFAIWRLNG